MPIKPTPTIPILTIVVTRVWIAVYVFPCFHASHRFGLFFHVFEQFFVPFFVPVERENCGISWGNSTDPEALGDGGRPTDCTASRTSGRQWKQVNGLFAIGDGRHVVAFVFFSNRLSEGRFCLRSCK